MSHCSKGLRLSRLMDINKNSATFLGIYRLFVEWSSNRHTKSIKMFDLSCACQHNAMLVHNTIRSSL